MEPLLSEIEALKEVLFTPVESFVTEKERAEKGEEWAEKMAHSRMFKQAIKAAYAARSERTLYTVALGFGPRWVQNFGLYPTQGQAEKARTQMLGALGNLVKRSAVLPLSGERGWELMQERASVPAEVTGDYRECRTDAAAFKNGWDGKAATRKKYEEAS